MSKSFRIYETELSVRAQNALIQIAKTDDWIIWADITKRGLRRIRGCGKRATEEILRYGIEHASPAQASRLKRELEGTPCPTCGKLP